MTGDKRNAGVTLLELIVVITILGILAGGVTVSLGLMNRPKASSAANKIDAKLEQVKTEAMSKSKKTYLILDSNEDGYLVASSKEATRITNDVTDQEKLGNNNMTVTVTLKDGSRIDVKDQTPVLQFDRESGAFLPCRILAKEGEAVETSVPVEITISANGRTSTIKLVPQTGKHYIM